MKTQPPRPGGRPSRGGETVLAMVILMAYPALLGGMIVVDGLLLLIALFTGWWWLFVTGVIATAGFVAWRGWMMARLDEL